MTQPHFMKQALTAIALIGLGLAMTIPAYSQDKIVTYDGATKTFTKVPRFLKEGSTLGIHYEHINPFAVSSNISFESISYKYDDGNAYLAKMTGLFGAVDAPAAAGDQQAKATAQFMNAFSKSIKQLQQQQQEEEEATGEENAAVTPLLDARQKTLANIYDRINSIQGNVRTIRNIMDLDTVIRSAMKNTDNISEDKMRAQIAQAMNSEVRKTKNITDLFHEKAENILGIVASLLADADELDRINVLLKAIDATYDDAERINELKEQATNFYKAYTGDNFNTMSRNVVIIASNYYKATHTTFDIMKSVTMDSDELVFSDEVKDSEGKIIYSIPKTKIFSYGGYRINTSIGIAATFGEVNGSAYDLSKNPTQSEAPADTGKVVLRESKDNRTIMFSPVVFFHWYPRLNSFVYPKLSLGLAPDFTSLANTKLFIGTGFCFAPSSGLAQRIGIDFGIAAGYTDVLKTKYKGYDNYAVFPGLTTDELTEKAIRIGGYFALSFNLGAVQQQAPKAE